MKYLVFIFLISSFSFSQEESAQSSEAAVATLDAKEDNKEEIEIDEKKTFIRKVVDYEKSSGETLIRLKCVRNPPLNRCSRAVFAKMAEDDCDPETHKISNIRTRGCTRDLKSGDEVCNFADVTCVEKSSD